MGVKNFSKVFEPREIKYKDLKDQVIAVDASVEIYRTALGIDLNKSLKDAYGMPTLHINALLLGVILKLKACGAKQYWVFDYEQTTGEEFHNPLKMLELKKRAERKKKAQEKLDKLKEKIEDELFSSDDEIDDEISKQQRAAFSLERFYREDTIFMLDMLEVPWVVCPPGFDAEQLCAAATHMDTIFGEKVNYVLTPDVDALLFGACAIIKRDTRKKKLFEYNLNEILETHDLTLDELRKVGLILGTDFAEKTPRIGPKTVLKKFRDVELTSNQEKALKNNFQRELTSEEINSLKIHNKNKVSFTDKKKYEQLLEWLQLVKSFNRERINKQFQKNKLFN